MCVLPRVILSVDCVPWTLTTPMSQIKPPRASLAVTVQPVLVSTRTVLKIEIHCVNDVMMVATPTTPSTNLASFVRRRVQPAKSSLERVPVSWPRYALFASLAFTSRVMGHSGVHLVSRHVLLVRSCKARVLLPPHHHVCLALVASSSLLPQVQDVKPCAPVDRASV
jgi:hypothetical protein